MDISFDPAKRAITLRERGLDFADAGLVFAREVATDQDTGETMARTGISPPDIWGTEWW